MANLLQTKEPVFTRPKVSRVPTAATYSAGFFLMLLVFFMVLASYGGLVLLNRAQFDAKNTLTRNIRDKEDNLRGDINQIFLLEKKLQHLKTLLSGHVFATNTFAFLEENTLPNVRFSNYSFNNNDLAVTVSGETFSFTNLATQVAVLEKSPHVESVEFGGLTLGQNNFPGFQLTIKLKPAFIRGNPQIAQTSN